MYKSLLLVDTLNKKVRKKQFLIARNFSKNANQFFKIASR